MTQKLSYPQQLIGQIVEKAVVQLYSLSESDFSIRTVRQTKHFSFGSLQFIDYAVPCFELAALVKISPNQVAAELSDYLKQEEQDSFTVEAVGGYLNFQLQENYLKNILSRASQWFTSPESTCPVSLSRLLVIGHEVPTDKPPILTDVFYVYLQDIARLVGEKFESQCLLSDNSEKTFAYAKKQTTEVVPALLQVASTGAASALLSSQPLSGNNLENTIAQVRRDWLGQYQNSLEQYREDSNELIAESTIADSVNNYFNEMPGNLSGSGIYKDDATGAAYYLEGEHATPLRSMKGLLYSAAYILYLLEQNLTTNASANLVVVAPQSLHSMIYDRAKYLFEQGRTESKVICFDPCVSKADIMEIQELMPSIKDHFVKINQLLVLDNQQNLNDPIKRAEILSLIDTPVILSEALADSKLPVLLDGLNQTTRVVRELAA